MLIAIGCLLQELIPRRGVEMDESKLEAVHTMVIPSNSLVLPPIVKEDEVAFISFQGSSGKKSATKDTLHSFGLESRKWNNADIATTFNQNQTAFPLLYKDNIAVVRVTAMKKPSAKIGIYAFREMSLWELIPFTSETIRPVELKNCQCVQSTRYIVLVSVVQSTIAFHVHKCSSQSWSSINCLLPYTKSPNVLLQSCTIAHHTIFCTVMFTEKYNQQKATVYKLKLEYIMEKGTAQNSPPDLETLYSYDSNVLQCHLFVASGEVMMMKVIVNNADKRSSTLELCSLNDALVNFKRQKKDYAFIMKLLSVVPLHSTTTYNNHVLIVYCDHRFNKTHLEIFCLP